MEETAKAINDLTLQLTQSLTSIEKELKEIRTELQRTRTGI